MHTDLARDPAARRRRCPGWCPGRRPDSARTARHRSRCRVPAATMPHDARCSSVRAVAVDPGEPVVTERHSGQIEARIRGVHHPGQPGKGQVTAQNAVRTAAGQARRTACVCGPWVNRSSPAATWVLHYPVDLCAELSATSGSVLPAMSWCDALRRMEYRGYDSAGIAVLDGNGGMTVHRRAGRLANLDDALASADPSSLHGPVRARPHPLGHARPSHRPQRPPAPRTAPARSRWSTTGSSRTTPPCAHELEADGVEFASDTDTEVAVHLVGLQYRYG